MAEIILDENQRQAVEYTGDKALLIQAGPGAGKTRVLIERIKYLLNNTSAKPESFLVITFTRKAAKELKQRLTDDENGISTSDANKMQISTIHSFCIKLLGESGKSAYTILDDDTDERRKMFIRRYRKDLDLVEKSYFSGKRLEKVMKKFDEFTTFDVDIDALIEYALEHHPVSDRYIDLIESCKSDDDKFEFPYDTVMSDEDYRKDYYNAQYQAIAKAYNKYLDILEDNNYMDFTILQKRLLELLEDDPSIATQCRFKNILIDEFQDTDPIQMKIFDKFINISDSFTVVGDDDQSIYGFRGSFSKFFKEFASQYNAEVITLSTNYRSGKKIVDFNEEYMDRYRNVEDEKLRKQLHANPGNDKPSQIYSLIYNYNKSDQQAEKIAELIQYLKGSGKINSYSDVGVLFRSVTTTNAKKLTEALEDVEIDYNLSESESYIKQQEVKALLTLIWYMKENGDNYIPSSWEKEWLGIASFDNKYMPISDDTKMVLNVLDTSYRRNFLLTAIELLPAFDDDPKKLKKLKEYKDVFTVCSDEMLEILYEDLGTPYDLSILDRQELLDIGIMESDVDFFLGLNRMKEEFYNDKNNSIMDLYYRLVNYIGIIGDKFDNPNEYNRQILANIAALTGTIANYEEIVYKHDLTGLYWFMNSNFDKYGSPEINDKKGDAVQIMTIHKSKGLEFPVVIVGGLENGRFPKEKNIISAKESYDSRSEHGYYTPLKYFNSKYEDIEEEVQEENSEEKRILYVAMTRAQRLLVLSYSTNRNGVSTPAINRMHEDNLYFPELTRDNFDDIIDLSDEKIKHEEEEKLEISFSSFSDYNKCPHEYNLKYNYGFAYSDNKYLFYGTIAHSIMNQIHQKALSGQEVTNSLIEEIIDKVADNNKNIDRESEVFTIIKKGILCYWNDTGKYWDIMASEYPFTSIRDNYILTGQIDLIIRDDNDITIVDFKTTDTDLKTVTAEDHKKYSQQLSMYAIALKDDPDYKDYNISKGIIYAIKNNAMIEYSLDDTVLSSMEEEIEDTVANIKADNFDKCNDDNCQGCNLFN